MKVKSESEVAQSCSTLSNPMDYSLPGSSIHRIFQARVLVAKDYIEVNGEIAVGKINPIETIRRKKKLENIEKA